MVGQSVDAVAVAVESRWNLTVWQAMTRFLEEKEGEVMELKYICPVNMYIPSSYGSHTIE